jgi:dUTP pyrophosphatase
MLEFIVEKINPNAQIPKFANETDAGADLYSPINITIPPQRQILIPLGIKVAIPPGYFIKFEPRSGLALKFEIDRKAGLIDESYTKEWGLILRNESDDPYHILKGERVAQAVIHKKIPAYYIEGIVDDSERGGFGSTGE